MKNSEERYKEKRKEWSEKADALLEELKACGEYKKLNDELLKRIEEMFEESMRLMREGIKILPLEEKIKVVLKILIARWDNVAFRFRWLLLKLYRIMLGLDI